ncbi:MAG: ABC transporter permease, partial [Pseudomonadota bacterium]
MSDVMLAADGTPLKRSLARALRRQKLRALGLIAPLLLFVLITFIVPIFNMLSRSVQNDIVADTVPSTVAVLAEWDGEGMPPDTVFDALYTDLFIAEEQKLHTRLGTRLNYQMTGASSMFRKSGRAVGRFDTDTYTDAFTDAEPAWEDPAHWRAIVAENASVLPATADAWTRWNAVFEAEGDEIGKRDLEDFLFTALYNDLNAASDVPAALATAQSVAAGLEPVSLKDGFIAADEDWGEPEIWQTIKLYSPRVTPGYFYNSVDLEKTPDGIEMKPENEQILVKLFGRTIWMSLLITFSCIALGYPIAWLLANLPMRQANLLLILVLLPFWTSLLVRTSSWKVMLQQQGVINDVLVWIGLVDDASRLIMINNQFGTIVAMTHILLPFMILPMYSVMQTIPPSYLRAAKSLGATNTTAFLRVYFPQSVPGIGAGSILVFILAIGYYITPEIVGGTKGVF